MSTTDRPERHAGATSDVDLTDLGTIGERDLQDARADETLRASRSEAREALDELELAGRLVLR